LIAFADTGFWYGLHVPKDRRHIDARALWQKGPDEIVTTDLVLGETWTLARVRGVSHGRAMELIDSIHASPRVEVVATDEGMRRQAWDWLRRHDERTYSYVDATSFVTMERRRLNDALTFDGDFAAAGYNELRPTS
jgi:uncharacterized protein